MLRTECGGCGHGGLTVFADLGETPLADVFAPTMDEARNLPRYGLRAATCDGCGLAQLLDVIPDAILWGEGYGFRTGGSPSSLAYMADLAAEATGQVHGKGIVVDIGCNDGTLMDRLIHEGLGQSMVIGVDPSAPVTGTRWLDGAIIREPFTAELAGQWKGEAALVTAVNVAAHVRDPHDFLEGIATMLAPDGVAVVEFQYFGDLLAGCMFDLIYHEHRFFYTGASFTSLARAHGLFLDRYRHTPAQGGSMRVYLRKRQKDCPVWEFAPSPRDLLAGFQARATYAKARLTDVVMGFHPAVVYGFAASAKSCTLLNWCGLGYPWVGRIVDATPSKHGRFAPGTGLPITGGGEDPAAYLLLASNYLGDIVRREQAAGYKGRFIVPLPLPVIV